MKVSDVRVGEWFTASGTLQRLRRIDDAGHHVSHPSKMMQGCVLAVDECNRLHTVHGCNSALLDRGDARKRAADILYRMHDNDIIDLLLAAGIVPHDSIEGRADQLLTKIGGSL